jgi:ketopantoate reductase
MKTLIVGKGIIGTIYGWALSEAGENVTHYIRPQKKVQGVEMIQLDILDERKNHKPDNKVQYAMHCVNQINPQDGYELIILPVNVNQLEEVLETLVPQAGNAVFLTLTSNWTGPELIDRYLPRERFLMGYPDGGGTVLNGVYWTNLGAEIHLGLLEGSNPNKLEQIKDMFMRADMKPDIQKDILKWLWVHNASAIGFAAGFAKHKSIKPFLKDTEILRTSIEATCELLEICEKRGVEISQFPEISFMSWPTWLVTTTMRWLYSTNKSMQRYTAHAASAGSLAETKVNYDAMLKSAHELGVATPAFNQLGQYLK